MIVIPARLKSSRFPEKMLADVLGLPLIVRTAKNVSKIDEVVVACDDKKILDICQAHQVRAILTDTNHQSGTDRCAEACRILKVKNDELVLNIQGDEPFLEPEVIDKLISVTKKTQFMASLAKEISRDLVQDPNLVKVITNHQSEAIYFSRSVIPYNRDENTAIKYFGHLGVYGFFNETLQEFCSLKKTSLEEIEKLEQLRAIYHKKQIKIDVVETKSIGIDTKEDLEQAILMHTKNN